LARSRIALVIQENGTTGASARQVLATAYGMGRTLSTRNRRCVV